MTAVLEWTRHAPNGWQVVPLRAVADYVVSNVDKVPADGEVPVRLCNYSDVYNNEFITQDLAFMQCTATEEEIRKFRLEVGDVIITKDSESWDDIGVPALVADAADDLVCGYHLALLRPHRDRLLPRFLLRCLQARVIRRQLELAANGVTRFGLPKAEIGAMRLPVPPLPVQQAIVAALDSATEQFDRLLGAKRRLLTLLAEKRRAIITSAVTRGLDPKAPMRDSGAPWLGEIPAHWSIRRLAWLFQERDERGEPDLPLLEVSIGSGVVEREFSEDRIENTAADFNTYKIARAGDVVFNKMRMWQGAVGVAPVHGLVSPDYLVAKPTGELRSDFANLLFRTESFSAECGRRSHGIVWDRLRLYWDGFREIAVPVPSQEQQHSLVEAVAAVCKRLDLLRDATERSLGILRERRSALITAAVTGEIEVVGVRDQTGQIHPKGGASGKLPCCA